MKYSSLKSMVILGVLAQSGAAFAQEPTAVEPPPADAAAPAEAAPAPEAAPPAKEESSEDEEKGSSSETSEGGGDGTRFRFGVSGGGGILSGGGYSFTYGGVDLRFGAQINDLIGVYAQPQLGFYAGSAGAIIGAGGLAGASVVVDFTPVDYFFAGVGAGYGILNNPGGAEIHFRVGAYPLVSRSDEGIRRKALMIGADLRLHMVSGITFVAPTVSIGYEAF
jgi:hypothetical protein